MGWKLHRNIHNGQLSLKPPGTVTNPDGPERAGEDAIARTGGAAPLSYPGVNTCMSVTVRLENNQVLGAHLTYPITDPEIEYLANQMYNLRTATILPRLYMVGNFEEWTEERRAVVRNTFVSRLHLGHGVEVLSAQSPGNWVDVTVHVHHQELQWRWRVHPVPGGEPGPYGPLFPQPKWDPALIP